MGFPKQIKRQKSWQGGCYATVEPLTTSCMHVHGQRARKPNSGRCVPGIRYENSANMSSITGGKAQKLQHVPWQVCRNRIKDKTSVHRIACFSEDTPHVQRTLSQETCALGSWVQRVRVACRQTLHVHTDANAFWRCCVVQTARS